MIERHLSPALGNKRLADVSYEDITVITEQTSDE